MPPKIFSLWFKLRAPISFRSHLILLIAAIMVPLVLFSVALVWRSAQDERVAFRKGASDRALSLMTAVDRKLTSSITILRAIAKSSRLDTGDLQGFYADTGKLLGCQRDWTAVNLAAPSGQQLLNLRRPYGAPLPKISGPLMEVVTRQRPYIDNMTLDPVTRQYNFAIRVPVKRDGTTKYILSAVMKPQTIAALLSSDSLPTGWVAVVLDRDKRIIARSSESDLTTGQLASASVRAAIDRAPEGWSQGNTIEGLEVYTTYNSSKLSGWAVGILIPAAAVETTFHRSLLYVSALGMLSLAVALTLAWFFSAKTVRSIQLLAATAEDLGLGKKGGAAAAAAAKNLASGISEVEVLRETLLTARQLIQHRSEDRDRVETALREVSERLELAQEAASIGTFERNLGTNTIRWSASQEKLYGLDPGSFNGMPADWAKRVHPDDLAAVEEGIRRATETMGSLRHEFRILRPDGGVRWVATHARVFTDKNGAKTRMLGVDIDITERKQAEAALREADRRKDDFLAMLGHELRNPLGVISTTTQLMRMEGPLDPALEEFREGIERQVGHMARMLNDLLDVSRIARGHIRLKKGRCDLVAVVRRTVEDHRLLLEENGQQVLLELPEAPLWIMGDQTRLTQVVGNLLQNANKFSDLDGRVTVRVIAEPAGTALLSVRDTGIGMQPESLARVFDPFTQEDRAIDRSRGGLGLGLALVKGLIELHGGTVQALSEGAGRGSELIIRLPLDEQALEPAAAPPAATKGTRSYRILVVEDNPAAARTIRLYLGKMGHETESALTGSEGIAAARRFKPEVILCDIGLPGLDGYAVCRALREENSLKSAYFIAVTGYGQYADRQRALEAGFDAHLIKPVDFSELARLLNEAELRGAAVNA